ncbi:MAG: peptide ABC transporter substrate-binding protein, partial [Pseudobutyrivibrio sp.]|nr:peptide ABC transporter substrate-binding protein [Pseudobutyrivibrio sp.]
TTGDLCTELDARRTRLYDAEQLVMEDAVIFPIYTAANATLVKANVSGIEFHPVALNRVYKNTVKE